MGRGWETAVTFIGMIGMVAVVALLVSPKAQTAAVTQAGASGFGNILGVAVSPVTGNQYSIDLSYPSSFGSLNTGSYG